MIYLSGTIRDDLGPQVGFMLTKRMGNDLPPDRPWAADNGRYASPEDYADDEFLAWLAERRNAHLLFATAPDVLGDHAATVALSLPILPRIRQLGIRAAFVAQDGIALADTPWTAFDCLFIGGTDLFKLSALVPTLVREAKRLGKWVHMGRVNSYRRLRLAALIGCDSADGTFVKFAPDHNVARMAHWFHKLHRQPRLALP